MKIIIIFLFSFFIINKSFAETDKSIYEKIDLFSEVLNKIDKEYVENVNQSDAMDAAINGVVDTGGGVSGDEPTWHSYRRSYRRVSVLSAADHLMRGHGAVRALDAPHSQRHCLRHAGRYSAALWARAV